MVLRRHIPLLSVYLSLLRFSCQAHPRNTVTDPRPFVQLHAVEGRLRFSVKHDIVTEVQYMTPSRVSSPLLPRSPGPFPFRAKGSAMVETLTSCHASRPKETLRTPCSRQPCAESVVRLGRSSNGRPRRTSSSSRPLRVARVWASIYALPTCVRSPPSPAALAFPFTLRRVQY